MQSSQKKLLFLGLYFPACYVYAKVMTLLMRILPYPLYGVFGALQEFVFYLLLVAGIVLAMGGSQSDLRQCCSKRNALVVAAVVAVTWVVDLVVGLVLSIVLSILPFIFLGSLIELLVSAVVTILAFVVVWRLCVEEGTPQPDDLLRLFGNTFGLAMLALIAIGALYSSWQIARWYSIPYAIPSSNSFLAVVSMMDGPPNFSAGMFYLINFCCVFPALRQSK